MVPDHLLQIATDLAEINTRRPRRTDLCRALSTVYYALFHCLARTCADSMAGRAVVVGDRPMWRRVYRALEHRQAKTRCENVPSWFQTRYRSSGLRSQRSRANAILRTTIQTTRSGNPMLSRTSRMYERR